MNKVQPYSPEDMKRRKKRSLVMALCLVVFLVIIFVTTVVKIYQAAHGVAS